MPQATLLRSAPDTAREAASPLAQDRAARRFAAWLADPSQRPAYALPSGTGLPAGLAAALVCPDLFLLDTPLGPDRLHAIVALAEGARASGQRLAILTSTPENANAIALALPAAGVGRALAASEGELPGAVADQTAGAMASAEWRIRRATLLGRHREANGLAKWWGEWNRLAEAEVALASEGELLAAEAERLVEESGSLIGPTDERAVTLHAIDEAARADAEIRRVLEVQIAEWRATPPEAHGLGGFVKKLFGGSKPSLNVPECIATAEARLAESDAATAERVRQTSDAEARYQERRQALIAEESARLRAAHDGRMADSKRERDALETARPAGGADPFPKTPAELEAELAASEEPTVAPSREAVQRLSAVIGPLAALESDPFFAPTHPETEAPFARVLFADAEDLNAIDFARAARLGGAWTMLGSIDLPRPAYRNGKPGRGEFFRETFEAVSASPFRNERGRTVVALASAGPPAALRREPLADFPAIELRFADHVDGRAELAEVAFPAGFDTIDVKRFLAVEIGVPKAQFLGLPEWAETADAVVCKWPGLTGGAPFDLGQGIRECLAGGHTAEFRFSTAAGWTRESADEWFREHFGSLPATRAARLPPSR